VNGLPGCIARVEPGGRECGLIPILMMTSALSTSWPGLTRPSTSLIRFMIQDVDARDKRGHDESNIVSIGMNRHWSRFSHLGHFAVTVRSGWDGARFCCLNGESVDFGCVGCGVGSCAATPIWQFQASW
jgi:hypothetical protein